MKNTLQALQAVQANKQARLQQSAAEKALKELQLVTDNITALLRRKAELEDLQQTLPLRLKINKKYTKHLQEEAVKFARQITNGEGQYRKPIYGIDSNGDVQIVIPQLKYADDFGLDMSWLSQIITNRAPTCIYANLFWTRNPDTPIDVITAHFNRYAQIHANSHKHGHTWQELFLLKLERDNDIFPTVKEC